jgi:hypothetical protein
MNARWLHAVETAIRTPLKGSGKGWFNLLERNREVYEGSKLRRLLRVVTFMMQARVLRCCGRRLSR